MTPHPPTGSPQHSQPTSSVQKKLENILQRSLTANKQTTVLITGPSGSGKSTLAIQSATHVGFDVIRFRPQDLSSGEAGTTEAAVSNVFQLLTTPPAVFSEDDDNYTKRPKAVVLDDLELWAPATCSSFADLRLITVLVDELSMLKEQYSVSGVFIATTSNPRSVHPDVIRNDLFAYTLSLHAVPLQQRLRLSSLWLQHMFALDEHDKELQLAADVMAEVTPGFMYADMQGMLSRFEEQWVLPSNDAPPMKVTDFVRSPVFQQIVDHVSPSLLSAIPKGSRSMNINAEDEVSLYGLESQVQLLRDCLSSVFQTSHVLNDSPPTPTMEALSKLGRLRGMILHGPSGSGKSALTRLAQQLVPKNTVNFLHADSTSIISSVIGEAERNVSTLFAVARAIAPSVLVVDNIDILAPCREDLHNVDSSGSAAETFNRILGTLLTELDGVKEYDDGPPVFILATTTSLNKVDPALLRPGRFEMHTDVTLPSPEARVKILQHSLRRVDNAIPDDKEMDTFDFESFKHKTEGWAAADIHSYAREMVLKKLRDRKSAVDTVEQRDLPSQFMKLQI